MKGEDHMSKITRINYIERSFRNHFLENSSWTLILQKRKKGNNVYVSSYLLQMNKVHEYLTNEEMKTAILIDLPLFCRKTAFSLPLIELSLSLEIQTLVLLLFTRKEAGDKSYCIDPAIHMLERQLINSNSPLLKKYSELFKLMSYIYQNLSKGLSINDLAEKMYMSNASLRRFCEKLVNKTPLELVNDIRICESKKLLMNTKTHIKEIAGEVGYQNSASFLFFFRQQTGLTPSQYRKASQHSIQE